MRTAFGTRGLPVHIVRQADDPAGDLPLVLFAGREECGMRAAVAHRNAEPLRVADHDIGTPFAGWREQREREQVGGNGDEPARLVDSADEVAIVVDGAVRCGILEQRSEDCRAGRERAVVADHRLPSACARPRPNDVDRLWVTQLGDEEDVASVVAFHGVAHGHRFRRRGPFVEQ
jgi:hypothetical protein